LQKKLMSYLKILKFHREIYLSKKRVIHLVIGSFRRNVLHTLRQGSMIAS